MKRSGAKLGQHFLIHSWAARALAYTVPLRAGERYLEIGPGKGVLTRELLALGPVTAVEKDPELVQKIRDSFPEELLSGKLVLFEDDVRNITAESLSLEHYVVAANIPYYITGEIVRQFLTAPNQPRALALLVQKEVAQRVVSSKESLLSLSVKAYGTARIAEKVPKKHFSPPPKVDSAILAIESVSKDFFGDITEDMFFRVAHAGFASKRKMVANNLAVVFGKEKALAALALAGISEKARAEDIHVEEWKSLTKALTG